MGDRRVGRNGAESGSTRLGDAQNEAMGESLSMWDGICASGSLTSRRPCKARASSAFIKWIIGVGYLLFVELDPAHGLAAGGIKVRNGLAHAVRETRGPAHADDDAREAARTAAALAAAGEERGGAVDDAR